MVWPPENDLRTKIEHLRAAIKRSVGSDYKKLSDPTILALSEELDKYIVQYLRERKKNS